MNKEKSLKDKAIQIKGKDYVLVADRILYFNEAYPNGSISSKLVSDPMSDHIIIKATVMPNFEASERVFTGYSQAIVGDGYINKTSALENAETSAVGRALAMMGIGVIESVASVDEINKATGSTGATNIPPRCDTCGKEGIEMKRKTGSTFWNCPNWSDHKDKGEKTIMVPKKKELQKEEEDFLNDLV